MIKYQHGNPEVINNYDLFGSAKEEIKVYDLIQNPITINTYNSNIEEISEKTLKSFILRDIDNFLLQLGNGFRIPKLAQATSYHTLGKGSGTTIF